MTGHAVVDTLVPFWAAEGEICRAYFSRPDRPARLEVDWLARQAAKELHDGVEPRVARVRAAIESGASAASIARETEELHEEAEHLVAFAEAHDVVARNAGLPTLAERDLFELASWPENDALREVRADHHRRHGALGDLATTFTEGGCAALFVAGAGAAGETPADRAIVHACRIVLDDEMEHLATGFADLRDRLAGVDPVDLTVLQDLVVEQSVARLHMRQAQFGAPVGAQRFAALLGGSSSRVDREDVEARLRGVVVS